MPDSRVILWGEPSDKKTGKVRTFESGATRDSDDTKPDFEGFLSPLVIHRFGEYMTKHRVQADGALRASDNWQRGIPKDAYIKSAFRHFVQWWLGHRGEKAEEDIEEALCALLFNVQGYIHELLKGGGLPTATKAQQSGADPGRVVLWPLSPDRFPNARP